MPILFFIAVLGAIFAYEGLAGGVTQMGTNSQANFSNPWKLPNCDSSTAQDSFSKDYDENFEKAEAQTGVPFALIKAHAVRESSLNPNAYHYDNSSSGASYGLLQVEWNATGPNANRLIVYGSQFSADQMQNGSALYDPDTNCYLGACIMRDNLNRFKGNIRDAINAYNTGVAESVRAAPDNYVNDVLKYYSEIVGQSVG